MYLSGRTIAPSLDTQIVSCRERHNLKHRDQHIYNFDES
jgi:hypothetical protein